MRSDHTPDWDVPRPALRLWLTLALGILGAILLPAREEFFVLPFANVRWATSLPWMMAVFAAVLLVRRAEGARVPWSMTAIMALVLALCLFVPPREAEDPAAFWRRFAWFNGVSALLLVAGVLNSGVRFRRGSIRSWIGCLMRGVAIVAAAPLLLFASRPDRGRRFSSPWQRLSKMAFVALPCLIAGSFAVPYTPAILGLRGLTRELTLLSIAFGLWTWIGCGLLFLLSRWPEYPRIPRPGEQPRPRLIHHLAAATVLGMALLLAKEAHPPSLFWWIAVAAMLPELWALLGLALLLMLSPWPGVPRLPRLDPLPKSRRADPGLTAVFLTLALLPVAAFAIRPFLYIVGGHLFSLSFDRIHVGTALDQPTIGKWLHLATVFSAAVIPHVAVARWMSDRETRTGHWAFATPSALLFLSLLGTLTVPFHWLIQYIASMGFTATRVAGVVYCLGGYAILLGCAVAWLDFLPPGYRYRRFLHHQGYEWATAQDASRILRHLRWQAYRVPPASDVETVPGSGRDAESLIAFMGTMAQHRREGRRRPRRGVQ